MSQAVSGAAWDRGSRSWTAGPSASPKKTWVLALLGISGVSAAAMVLMLQRRKQRQLKTGQQGKRSLSADERRHPRTHDPDDARSLPETFAWSADGVDIGAVLGVDIGGTLSKLVYFEKKAPSEAQSARRVADDPLGKKVDMKRTVSLGNLHDTTEQQQALKEFYSFMDKASRLGDSGIKDTHLSAYSHALGGALHFFLFETRFMESAVEIISNSRVHRNIQAVGCTGGGAFKFEDFFLHRLGVRMLKMDEMECLVRGMQFALVNIPRECYTFRTPSEEAEASSGAEAGPAVGGTEGDAGGPGPEDNLRNRRMREITEVGVKREYSMKVVRSIDNETSSPAYPAIVVSLGSGVSIIKVDGPSNFKRVSGSSIGGGTYWGLCKLLTKAGNYDESLQMASRGNSDHVDMLVGDIYGRGYSKFQLSSNTLASSFGKIGGMKAPREPGSGVTGEDLAKALLVMISLNIGQVAYLNAKLFNTRRIYFVGNFLRHNHLAEMQLAFAIDYWSSGEMEALFLEHEGYLGALGAFLMSGTEEATEDANDD